MFFVAFFKCWRHSLIMKLQSYNKIGHNLTAFICYIQKRCVRFISFLKIECSFMGLTYECAILMIIVLPIIPWQRFHHDNNKCIFITKFMTWNIGNEWEKEKIQLHFMTLWLHKKIKHTYTFAVFSWLWFKVKTREKLLQLCCVVVKITLKSQWISILKVVIVYNERKKLIKSSKEIVNKIISI